MAVTQVVLMAVEGLNGHFFNFLEKPVPQGSPTGIFGILGVAAVVGLIAGVVGTVCVVYKRGQKPCTETDGDQTDLPPAHKPDPPRFKKKYCDGRGGLAAGDIQVVHLGKEEEMQKLPLQPPYYDMAQSEPTTFTDKQNSGHRDCDVHYAELDTAALSSSLRPMSSVHTGEDIIEYASIQPSIH